LNAGIIAAGWGERLAQQVPKALTPIGNRKLIDFALDGFEAAGIKEVTCIINESAQGVQEYVAASGRKIPIDWIVKTTPSSMHSFLIVLEHLAQKGASPCLMTTVDSVCAPETYVDFLKSCALFPNADVVLGLTDVIDDEKPLRVAMSGNVGTGLMPDHVAENPEAFEIVAMTNNGFDSDYVTSGFYFVKPAILKVKDEVLTKNFTALRQYLGFLLKYGYRFYGAPVPPVVDVDRPQDIQAAEHLLNR
jgi:NDP-sugar pyrophosphorylase family protein